MNVVACVINDEREVQEVQGVHYTDVALHPPWQSKKLTSRL